MAAMEWREEWGLCPCPTPDYELYEGIWLGEEGKGGIRVLLTEYDGLLILV